VENGNYLDLDSVFQKLTFTSSSLQFYQSSVASNATADILRINEEILRSMKVLNESFTSTYISSDVAGSQTALLQSFLEISEASYPVAEVANSSALIQQAFFLANLIVEQSVRYTEMTGALEPLSSQSQSGLIKAINSLVILVGRGEASTELSLELMELVNRVQRFQVWLLD